ncbi:MAG: RloB domain-containing protein [Clostridia bacterium]|nr:RloB domain-containing protein [Clostridia bacterium]
MAMSRSKGYNAKPRNTGQRKRRSLVLLSAEGNNKTETRYFTDMARALNLNIRFAPGNYTDPVQMVNELKNACREYGLGEEPGDKAFCLVDSDVNPDKDRQIVKADVLSKKAGIALIVSAPCFEVWCLCHFGCSFTHYNSGNAVVQELLKKLPGFQKSGEGLYKVLADNTGIAIANAKTLEKACIEAGYVPHTVEFSPSTEVYRVVEYLLMCNAGTQKCKM